MKISSACHSGRLLTLLAALFCTSGMLSAEQALAASWSPAKIVSTYTLLALPTNTASVAVGDNGDAIAVWINEADYSVKYAKRTLGVWSAARILYRPSALNGEMTADAQVVMTPDGNATAVFATTTPGTPQYCVVGGRVVRCLGPSASYAKVARMSAGATAWSKPAALSAKGIAVANTHIAIDAIGNAVAMWTYVEKSGALTQLQTASTSVSGAWSAPQVRYSASTILFPQLALDGAGDVALAWQERMAASSPYRVRVLMAPVGQADTIVDAATLASPASGLKTGIDDTGIIHAVWNDGYSVSRVQCSVTATCDTPQLLVSAPGLAYGAEAYAYAADLAVAANGDALVAWTEMNSTSGEWTVVGQLHRGAEIAASFQLPVDAQLSVPMADVDISRDGSSGMVGWVDYGSGDVQVERWEPQAGWSTSAIGSAVWGSQVLLGCGPNAHGSAVWIAGTSTEFKYRVMAAALVF